MLLSNRPGKKRDSLGRALSQAYCNRYGLIRHYSGLIRVEGFEPVHPLDGETCRGFQQFS